MAGFSVRRDVHTRRLGSFGSRQRAFLLGSMIHTHSTPIERTPDLRQHGTMNDLEERIQSPGKAERRGGCADLSSPPDCDIAHAVTREWI